jgi:hypothetical protein
MASPSVQPNVIRQFPLAFTAAAFVAPDERMKAEARQVHVLRPRCVIERAQNVCDPSRVLHAQPASVSRREEAFQGLVSERPDHAAT